MLKHIINSINHATQASAEYVNDLCTKTEIDFSVSDSDLIRYIKTKGARKILGELAGYRVGHNIRISSRKIINPLSSHDRKVSTEMIRTEEINKKCFGRSESNTKLHYPLLIALNGAKFRHCVLGDVVTISSMRQKEGNYIKLLNHLGLMDALYVGYDTLGIKTLKEDFKFSMAYFMQNVNIDDETIAILSSHIEKSIARYSLLRDNRKASRKDKASIRNLLMGISADLKISLEFIRKNYNSSEKRKYYSFFINNLDLLNKVNL